MDSQGTRHADAERGLRLGQGVLRSWVEGDEEQANCTILEALDSENMTLIRAFVTYLLGFLGGGFMREALGFGAQAKENLILTFLDFDPKNPDAL